MTDKLKDEIVEKVEDKENKVEVIKEVKLSSTELEAIDEGWKTKEDWIADGKDEADWRPAKEFKERGELFRKIDALAHELKTTRSTMTALKGHYEKVKETEFKRALDTLKQEKKLALENGDVDAVIDIDEQISNVKDTQKAQKVQVQQQPEIHPDFTVWVQRNQWYANDREMQAFADSIGRAYALNTPGIEPNKVLQYVTSKVKQAYPDKFTNPRREAPSPVDGAKAPRKNKEEDFALSEDEERVMNKLIKQKVLTKEQYIAELKSYKERR